MQDAISKLDTYTAGVVQTLMTQADSSPVYLSHWIGEITRTSVSQEVFTRVETVLANHKKSQVWQTRDQKGKDFRFEFVKLLESIPPVLKSLGLATATREIAYMISVRSLEYCQSDCDKALVRALHDAQLGLDLLGSWSDATASPAPMGISLSGMAASWDAPPLGEMADIPQHVEDVLVQLNAGYQVPLLVGEPGVGKSTIARQIAYMLYKKDHRIPSTLHSKKLLSISRGDLVGGTKDRGELEVRTQRLLELCDRKGGYIIFLDEIHSLFDRSAEAKIIGNMLKGPMAEGKLRCFGATTRSEFAEYLSNDPPLVERFRLVDVPEASQVEAIKSFTSSRNSIMSAGELNGWKIGDEAIEEAVKLSSRYMPLQKLPRKAANLLRTTIAECQYKHRKEKVVTADDVRAAISKLVRIPNSAMAGSVERQTRALSKDLKTIVVGHDGIVDRVSETLVRREAMKDRGLGRARPLASFLFHGPSGIGKRLLGESIGRKYLIAEAALQDCVSSVNVSKYTGESGSNRFRGAPPGYVGFGPVPPIYRDPRTSPRRVILIEGLDLSDGLTEFIQPILTNGIGYDGTGNATDFSGCVLVLIAHRDDDQLTGDAAKLMGIVDESIAFDRLAVDALREIANRLVMEAASKNIILDLNELVNQSKSAEMIRQNWESAVARQIK
jgi:hypothetical protein